MIHKANIRKIVTSFIVMIVVLIVVLQISGILIEVKLSHEYEKDRIERLLDEDNKTNLSMKPEIEYQDNQDIEVKTSSSMFDKSELSKAMEDECVINSLWLNNPNENTNSNNEFLIDSSASYIYENNENLTPVNYNSKAILPLSEDMGQDYINDLIFICDSPTYWLKLFQLLEDKKDTKQIWTGPTGTMTLAYQSSFLILDPYDFEEKPIREVVKIHQPKYIVVALGLNGISFMDEDSFTKEYKELVEDIKKLSPSTIVLLQSIYPIATSYKYYGSITNAIITKANSWILTIAEETNCMYLDTISVLLNDEGNVKEAYIQKDGLHLNAEGLLVVLDYIQHHGKAN